ncbi:sec1 family domain-containing protein 2 isoform X2 [Orussus abietinus]|nr:sec1 family domain-containing protein 2 isoform X2 [Orussus abietinus]XP_012287132.1 sec1 family domain-containing protein 2 isoform X2 [Orussus abietinus]
MSNSIDLQEFASACWKDIFSVAHGAAVYIDHAAAECLHWFTRDKAYTALINAGAVSVHDLAMYNFRYVRVKGTKKAVIIYTSADPIFYQRTLKMIIEKNTFESCIIICAVHYGILNYASIFPVEEESSYNKLKEDVLNWMSTRNPAKEPHVDVIFRPVFTACIDQDLFTTPPFGDMMPNFDEQISQDQEIDLTFLVSSLHSLFTHFNLKEDIYSIGKFSEYIAEKLENLPAAIDRRKRLFGPSNVSLILLDRTLDLCKATSQNTECVLARILTTLPRLPHHYNDVAINMAPICAETELQETQASALVPGCLATDDPSLIKLLISEKQKMVLLKFNQLLMDMTVLKVSPKAKFGTRITVYTLEKLLHKLRDSEGIESLTRFSKKIQIIMAVIQALKSEKTPQLELLISLEKLILQNLAVSRDSSSVLAQLSNIIKNRCTRGLDMENLLILLIHIFSLAGTEINFSAQQEEHLNEALKDAIYEDIKKCNETTPGHEMSIYYQTLLLLGVTSDDKAKEDAEDIAQRIIDTLHAIAQQRASLENYRCLITKPSAQELAQYTGLLECLIRDLLHPNRPEIPDLQQKASSFMSTGFNLFRKGKTKRHPGDNPLIIIYVVGGVTADEARIINDISSRNINNPRIILAGSRLLNPLNVTDKVLLSTLTS